MAFKVISVQKDERGGFLTYVENHKYPIRAWPQERDLHFVDILKRVLIASARFVTRIPLTPKRLLKALTEWMSDIYWADVSIRLGRRFPPEGYSQSTKEVLRTLLEINPYKEASETSGKWCYYLAAIWETDQAYRRRGQDIFQELNKVVMKKYPKYEVMRLLDLALEREIAGVKPKLLLLKKLLNIALISTTITKIVQSFFLELSIEEIKISVEDRYWMANMFDYNYEGKTYEERMAWRLEEDKDWSQPEELPDRPKIAVNPPNEAFYQLNEEEAKKMCDSTAQAIMDTWRQTKAQMA